MSIWRRSLSGLAAIAVTLAMFSLIAFSLDASAVRVALGITPELDVPYVETRSEMVDTMLDMAEVGPDDHVIDLGTGDGRILFAAAQDRGARGLGVDLDPVLVDDAADEAARLGLSDRVTFREQDLFETPLHEADVVTMFLLPSVNLRLRPRLLEELKPGTRVVSNRFDMGDWRPDEVRRTAGYPAYLWIVPADVAGSWMLAVGARSIALELEQQFQDVTGTAMIDGQPQAIAFSMRGDRLRFSLEIDGEYRTFDGVVRDDRIIPADEADWLALRQSD
ncbi:SAM-dependent methyltransferase [Erythrobacter alti]|uniref:SAM-dependent methyltransferase n=1 Tax=Erythrobacter alti TaxID=1896145 RepID=UPI0030F41EF1